VLSKDGNQVYRAHSGLAIDSQGNIYAGDSGHFRVQKFDRNGRFISKFGGEGRGDGEFRGELSLAVDMQDNVYVADAGNGRIQKFDSSGNFLLIEVEKYNSAGQFLFKWNYDAAETNPKQEVSEISSIAVDSQYYIYLLDAGKRQILKFDQQGKLVSTFGKLVQTNEKLDKENSSSSHSLNDLSHLQI
jgi:DNA-binding beta-propeller fold protein YncE